MEYELTVTTYLRQKGALYTGQESLRLEHTVQLTIEGSFTKAANILEGFFNLADRIQRANAEESQPPNEA